MTRPTDAELTKAILGPSPWPTVSNLEDGPPLKWEDLVRIADDLDRHPILTKAREARQLNPFFGVELWRNEDIPADELWGFDQHGEKMLVVKV